MALWCVWTTQWAVFTDSDAGSVPKPTHWFHNRIVSAWGPEDQLHLMLIFSLVPHAEISPDSLNLLSLWLWMMRYSQSLQLFVEEHYSEIALQCCWSTFLQISLSDVLFFPGPVTDLPSVSLITYKMFLFCVTYFFSLLLPHPSFFETCCCHQIQTDCFYMVVQISWVWVYLYMAHSAGTDWTFQFTQSFSSAYLTLLPWFHDSSYNH